MSRGSADSITGTSARATCWSITINNPTITDYELSLPPNWNLTGQLEKGKEGTTHYQGALTTPQVRFSAVKKVFPKAHIEIARNKGALLNYVHKDDTRVGTVSDVKGAIIPTLFDYQHTVAIAIVKQLANEGDGDFERGYRRRFVRNLERDTADRQDIMLSLVDDVVRRDIEAGQIGIEYIAINPMWISAWKKFGISMLRREYKATLQTNDIINAEEDSHSSRTQDSDEDS